MSFRTVTVPFLGIEPVIHNVQHKSHLQKTMGIASAAFVPKGNDMTAGGEAHLVSFVRVGKQVKAKKDTYRRVYAEDGTYTMPVLPQNQLRRKGSYYFTNMEITGSRNYDQKKKEPRFNLQKDFFERVEIPALDKLCAKVSTATGKQAVVRYQMDNAGPHADGNLQEYLKHAFDARGWLLVPQPSNSPVANIMDDCVFPKMSKDVSREQGITHGSLVMQPDEIWAAATKCWKNFPLDTLARSFIRHSQISCAIAQCQGSDDFIREKGGLHMNVRKCCFTACNDDGTPKGVEVVIAYDPESESDNGDNMARLRYDQPNVKDDLESNLRRMKHSEINLLFNQLPSNHVWFDTLAGVWSDVQLQPFMDEDDVSLTTGVGGRIGQIVPV